MKNPRREIVPVQAARPADEADPSYHPVATRLDRLRSLTRLAVGGAVLGVDGLLRQLEIWEERVAAPPPPDPDQALGGESSSEGPPQPHAIESEGPLALARYAAIGWLFEAQGTLSRAPRTLLRAEKLAGKLAGPALRPMQLVSRSFLLAPVRRRYAALVQRGEEQVERWVALGREEEHHSRSLADAAIDDTIGQSIEYLTTNPGVQDLVEKQSTGLANEVISEVRERSVSADTLLEGLARNLFRLIPRPALPGPPPEVRHNALSFRPIKGKDKV